MSRLLLKGGRIVDPSQKLDQVWDLLINDDRIEAVGKDLPQDSDTEVIDLTGKVVAPGFVDMHVHLREPGYEHKETVASGTAAAAAGGFTGVACMPNTDPVNDNRAVTELILERAADEGTVAVYPIGAVSVGSKGEEMAEIGDLVDAGCVAVSDDGHPVATSFLMRRALEYTKMFGIPVIDHCEDLSLSAKSSMHEGAASARLGLRGHPAAAEEIIVARDVILAELTGGRLHCAHLSTAGALRQVREAKSRDVAVTCEVMPHHFTLIDEAVSTFDTNTKMSPPLRGPEDLEAVLAAFADGTVDVIATDHAPHHADEKNVEYDIALPGLIGLETAVPLACEHLVHTGVIDVPRLVELFSTNPCRILGIAGGTLEAGAPANVTILDMDRQASVDISASRSKSRNSPFDGMLLRGWPAMTIFGGKVVWRSDT
jgi:dihydroorotase